MSPKPKAKPQASNKVVSPIDNIGEFSVIIPDIKTFYGLKSLSDDDVGANVAIELPKTVVSWGSKRILDAEAVAIFQTLKKRAERTCLAYGTRFIGGYLVHDELVKQCVADLGAIREEYERERTKFLDAYSGHVEAWATQHPEWGDRIRRAAPKTQDVAARLACHVTCFKLSKSAADAEGWLTETIQTIPNRALRELATSVAPLAMEALQRGFYGRRILTTLAPHIAKLKTMVMLNEAVAAVGYTLEDLVQDVVDPTCIGGAQYLALNLIFSKIRDGSALGEPMSYYDITEKVAELLKPEQEAEETTVGQVETATEGEIDNGIEPAISTVPGGNAQVTFEEASSAWSF